MLIFQLGAPFYETACVGLCQHAVKLERMRVPRVPKQATLSVKHKLAGSLRRLLPCARARGARAGKLAALAALLGGILDDERLRCVVASSSTAALDLVAALCARRGWATVRIDGGTEPGRRQEVVDGFNLYNRGQARLAAEQRHCAGHDRR